MNGAKYRCGDIAIAVQLREEAPGGFAYFRVTLEAVLKVYRRGAMHGRKIRSYATVPAPVGDMTIDTAYAAIVATRAILNPTVRIGRGATKLARALNMAHLFSKVAEYEAVDLHTTHPVIRSEKDYVVKSERVQ